MKIKRLDICGFKSFPDKMTLVFDKPIVGIVGPNGCGKSNIVDAVRWVMGEQRIKSLRGATREDIIFAGTEKRAPMGMAEVTLTFDNTDKLAPPAYNDYAEIGVTRKLYRNGDSEYYLNNTPCRLKDITDLFLGTGAGSKAYSIIEQGHISLIVSAKADDRRLMIEEAAGITRFHTRKREAERKMAATKQNLLRVTDVIAELKKQLGSLSRQAKKAERHKEYKQRIKGLDLEYTSYKYSECINEINGIIDDIEKLDNEREGMELKLSAMEGEVDARNLELVGKEQGLGEQQEQLYLLDQANNLDERNLEVFAQDIERILTREKEIVTELEELEISLKEQSKLVKELEEEQSGALDLVQQREKRQADADERQRKALEAFNKQQYDTDKLKRGIFDAMSNVDRSHHKLETLGHRMSDNDDRIKHNQNERAEVEKNYSKYLEEKQHFAEELGGLKQFKLQLDTERDEQTKKLAREREIYMDLEERLSQEREQLTNRKSRFDSLKELDKSLEGFSEGVKSILADEQGRFEDGELVDALARLIEVDSGYETAVGSALGERLQWLMVSDQSAAIKGIDILNSDKSGRAGFVPAFGPEPELMVELPDGSEPLIDHVKALDGSDSVIERMLSEIMVCETIEAACSAYDECKGAYSFVTTSGEVVDKSGALLGGSGENLSQAILKRRREMQDLTDRIEKMQELCDQLSMQRDDRIAAIRELEGAVESSRQKGHEQEIRILEQQKDLHHLESQLDQSKRRMDALDREALTFVKERDEFVKQQTELEAICKTKTDKQKLMEKELAALQETLSDLSEERDLAQQAATEMKVELAQAAQRRKHLESELVMSRQRTSDLSGRMERVSVEKENGTVRVEELERMIERTKKQFDERVDKRESLKKELDIHKDALAKEQEEIRQKLEEVRTVRQKLEEAKKKLADLQLVRSERSIEAKHLEERVDEKYGLSLADEFEKHLTEEIPDEGVLKEMSELHSKVERMGEVNLTAISEYDRVSERYQFLLDQEEDLTNSLSMLEDAIKKINRTTRKRFKETFEEVNAKFSELYPQLFGGGEAYLEFTDPQDLLKTGVEIIARPPGKKLQSVNLLSGGEKALTALSLIFAIFLYKPTPFCLLDEVDAPLDDINITRVNNTLQKISKVSQFILITHNKKTMEITNTLYGVTQEDAGISKIVSVNLT